MKVFIIDPNLKGIFQKELDGDMNYKDIYKYADVLEPIRIVLGLLETSWLVLEPSWRHLGPLEGQLGALGRFLAHLGTLLEPS